MFWLDSTLCWLFMVLVILVVFVMFWLDSTVFLTLCYLFMVLVILVLVILVVFDSVFDIVLVVHGSSCFGQCIPFFIVKFYLG